MFDIKTKEPLPHGSVWISKTKIGATTDVNGNYAFFVADTLKSVSLMGSYINYELKEVRVNFSGKKEVAQDFVLVSKPGVECPGVGIPQSKKNKTLKRR